MVKWCTSSRRSWLWAWWGRCRWTRRRQGCLPPSSCSSRHSRRQAQSRPPWCCSWTLPPSCSPSSFCCLWCSCSWYCSNRQSCWFGWVQQHFSLLLVKMFRAVLCTHISCQSNSLIYWKACKRSVKLDWFLNKIFQTEKVCEFKGMLSIQDILFFSSKIGVNFILGCSRSFWEQIKETGNFQQK